MLDQAFLITSFVTMFVIIDPIALTPMFVALTQGMTPSERRVIALRACLVAMGILLVFAFFGEALLGFIGISMAAFKIAGGILLLITALDMLFERRTKRREGQADEDSTGDDPSVFPLAIPLIAGPGAIATVILLTGSQDDWSGFFAVIGIVALIMVTTFGFFLLGAPLDRALGKTGINVVTRLLGMLLAALAVQFMLDGLAEFGLLGGAPI